ncbi:hypothetical protein ACFX2I_020203 [Malus domestica]
MDHHDSRIYVELTSRDGIRLESAKRLRSTRDEVSNLEEVINRIVHVDDQCDRPTLLLGARACSLVKRGNPSRKKRGTRGWRVGSRGPLTPVFVFPVTRSLGIDGDISNKKWRKVDGLTRDDDLSHTKKICSSPVVEVASKTTPPFTMNLLSWNCRGLGKAFAVQALLDIIQ